MSLLKDKISGYPLGGVQAWLQGAGYSSRRPWAVVQLGNLLSSVRYWHWQLVHRSRRDDPAAVAELMDIVRGDLIDWEALEARALSADD